MDITEIRGSRAAANLVLPGRPLWLSAMAIGVLAAAAVCYPAWPGHFGYDALYAYQTSLTGIENMVWPPMHAYLFWVSRNLGMGVGGLFAAQVFILFFSAVLCSGLLIRRRSVAVLTAVGFVGVFVVIPPMLGVAMSQWRDVPTASFAILAVALWLLASWYRSWPIFAAAAVALGVSVSLRYNAFALFALVAPLMMLKPFIGRAAGTRTRVAATVALSLSVACAWASTEWRLPDLKHVPAANTRFLIQLFDLLGVSACSDRSFLPVEFTKGVRLTGAQVRELYDPRHVQMAFGAHAGVPELDLSASDTELVMDHAWRDAIPQHLGCYFAHRNIVAVEQLGLEAHHVFYPVHGSVDPNPYGIKLARPGLSSALTRYVAHASEAIWRRPFWLYVFASLATAALVVRRDRRWIVGLALTGGAFANVALLYLIGPAADARYIFPSNVFCALVVVVATAMLCERSASRE
jgi:hypothetical protein